MGIQKGPAYQKRGNYSHPPIVPSNSQFGDQKGCGVCLARMSAAGQIFAPAKSTWHLGASLSPAEI